MMSQNQGESGSNERKNVTWWRLLCFVLAVLWLFWAFWQVKPVLRESDQASLLHGALQLAMEKNWQAEPYALGDEAGRGFYRVGTFWGSYLLNGAWIWSLEAMGELDFENLDANQLLLWTNRLAAAMMSLGVFFLGFNLSRSWAFHWMALMAFLGFLCAPAILLSASFASPNALSVGFLLMLLAACVQKPSGDWGFLKGLLTFFAVACRADALLVLPILCWIQVQPMSWQSLWGRRDFWWMGIGALLALGLGIWLSGAKTEGLFPPLFFKLEAMSAFLVFGLGASLLLLLAACWRVLTLKERFLWVRVVALLLLLLPLGFYSLQLYSPRHLMVVAFAALIPLVLTKPRALRLESQAKLPRERRNEAQKKQDALYPQSKQAAQGKGAKAKAKKGKGLLLIVGNVLKFSLLFLAAVLPLFLGLILPQPSKPQLAWGTATRYPTTDGLWPMGSLIAFQGELRQGGIDHHQEIWKDALTIGQRVGKGQEVYFDRTNQLEVYALAGKMQGWQARILSAQQASFHSRAVLFERGDLQINKIWYAGEDNPHAQLPDWESERWARGLGEGLIQLLPEGGSARSGGKLDWLPITLSPLFEQARFTELEALSTRVQTENEPSLVRFRLPKHLAGARLVLAFEDGRAWDLGGLRLENWSNLKSSLESKSQVYAGETPPKVDLEYLGFQQEGLLLDIQWRQQAGQRPSKPRLFVRQFPDYMRY